MSKFTKIVFRVALSCALLGAAFIIVGKIFGGTMQWSYNMNSKDNNVFLTEEDIKSGDVKLDSFKELKVEVSSIDVYVVEGDEFKLEYNCIEDYIPEVSCKNDMAYITQPSQNGSISFIYTGKENSYYKITVPSKTEYNFHIESSSGDISVESINFNGALSSSSGDVKITNCNSDKVTSFSSSGSLCVENSNISVFEQSSSSGSASFENCVFDSLKSQLSSGELYIETSSINALIGKCTSGDLKLSDSSVNNVTYSNSSGSVELDLLNKQENYNIKLHTSSGTINVGETRCEKMYESKSNIDNSIEVKTTSGDINISFK